MNSTFTTSFKFFPHNGPHMGILPLYLRFLDCALRIVSLCNCRTLLLTSGVFSLRVHHAPRPRCTCECMGAGGAGHSCTDFDDALTFSVEAARQANSAPCAPTLDTLASSSRVRFDQSMANSRACCEICSPSHDTSPQIHFVELF